MAHLLIAATHKSSGKTTVTTGLAAALARRGMAVQPFKKGPDYIDPMWLSRAAGSPCCNLDFHCMEEAEIIAAFCRRDAAADISIVETNKGLFDGVDVEGRDSNAALASLLGAPVVLVIDTLGMTRGIAPLVLGYMNFDPGVRIAGVDLNKVGGPRHEGKLRAALEYYTDLPVLGAIGRDRALEIPERHLGLVPANEAARRTGRSICWPRRCPDNVDLDRIVEDRRHGRRPAPAPPLSRNPQPRPKTSASASPATRPSASITPTIWRRWKRRARKSYRSTAWRTTALPDVDGLFIGGGFPETQMAALEANQEHAGQHPLGNRRRAAHLRRMRRADVSVAQPDLAGETREMVGVIPGDASCTAPAGPRLCGAGGNRRRPLASAGIKDRRAGPHPGPRIPLRLAGKPAGRLDLRLARGAWPWHRRAT